MTVYVTKLKVQNYRSCVETELNLSAFTAVVGRNNCGKSNCLNALEWLVRRRTLTANDFNDTGLPIIVEGVLEGITDADLDTLGTTHRRSIEGHIEAGRLTIRRTQPTPDTLSSLDVYGPAGWGANPGGIDQSIQKLFPDPIRIGAMENAEEDASKAKTSTTIGKLLATMLSSIEDRHREDLAPYLDSISAMVSAEGTNRFRELAQLDRSINEKIAGLFPGMSVRLDFPVPEMHDLIKAGSVRVYEGEGPGRPFGRYGHGAQRAIQMALVRHLADVKRGGRTDGGATLLLVDEPELYMHPFAIEQVREALRTLASSGYQVVFSTHSSQMVLASDAKNALLLTKEPGTGTKARPRLEQVINERERNAAHQMAHLFSLTNSSQVLFADKVILTEGPTELRLLPNIFSTLAGQTLAQSSIALIAQSGANNTKKSMEILDALGLPSCAIADLDFAFQAATAYGFLPEDDEDLAACKRVLVRLAAEGAIRLNEANGLPMTRHSPVSAEAAYALMAAEPEAVPHVSGLAKKLLRQRVWLWTKGSIEMHLGLSEKREAAWLDFQLKSDELGLQRSCADFPSVERLVNWMAEP